MGGRLRHSSPCRSSGSSLVAPSFGSNVSFGRRSASSSRPRSSHVARAVRDGVAGEPVRQFCTRCSSFIASHPLPIVLLAGVPGAERPLPLSLARADGDRAPGDGQARGLAHVSGDGRIGPAQHRRRAGDHDRAVRGAASLCGGARRGAALGQRFRRGARARPSRTTPIRWSTTSRAGAAAAAGRAATSAATIASSVSAATSALAASMPRSSSGSSGFCGGGGSGGGGGGGGGGGW